MLAKLLETIKSCKTEEQLYNAREWALRATKAADNVAHIETAFQARLGDIGGHIIDQTADEIAEEMKRFEEEFPW